MKLSLTVGPSLDPTASETGCARAVLLDLFDVFCVHGNRRAQWLFLTDVIHEEIPSCIFGFLEYKHLELLLLLQKISVYIPVSNVGTTPEIT